MVLLLLLLFTCRDVHGNVDAANGDATCVDADCVVVAYVDVDGCIVGVDVVVVAADDDVDVLNLLC
jgi:hypothetical protein